MGESGRRELPQVEELRNPRMIVHGEASGATLASQRGLPRILPWVLHNRAVMAEKRTHRAGAGDGRFEEFYVCPPP